MAVASYIKFHPKEQQQQQKHQQQQHQRHSVEVFSASYLQNKALNSQPVNANIKQQQQQQQLIPIEEVDKNRHKNLPTAMRLLYYLWTEMKGYCQQAILHQVLPVLTPCYNKQQPPQQKSSKKKSKTLENASFGTEKESFYQLCDMCGHYFQHPVTYHMRLAHTGCGKAAGGRGYNSGN